MPHATWLAALTLAAGPAPRPAGAGTRAAVRRAGQARRRTSPPGPVAAVDPRHPAGSGRQAAGREATAGAAAGSRPGRGAGRRRRDPRGEFRRLGRLHRPDRPREDLLRPDPAEGAPPKGAQPRPRLPVRVVPAGRERPQRGRARDGLPDRENGPAQAGIGQATYALLTKEQNAWLKNPAEESQAIATMARGQSVTVKAQSQRGNELTDRYSLRASARPSSAPARNAPDRAALFGAFRLRDSRFRRNAPICGLRPDTRRHDLPWRRRSTSPSSTPMRLRSP